MLVGYDEVDKCCVEFKSRPSDTMNRNLTAVQEKSVKMEKEQAALNAANALLAGNSLIWELW